MHHRVMGYVRAGVVATRRGLRELGSQVGQGSVEYVALIMLVGLLIVGTTAALSGNSKSIVKTISGKIENAIEGAGDNDAGIAKGKSKSSKD